MAKKTLKKHAREECEKVNDEQNKKKKVALRAFDKAHRAANSSLVYQSKNDAMANGVAEGVKEIIKNSHGAPKLASIDAPESQPATTELNKQSEVDVLCSITDISSNQHSLCP